MTRVLVIGDLEIARITCATLTARGTEVVHLPEPTDAELHDALSAPADAVAVLVRGDVSVLRYALLVEHLQPLVRLVATVFDRTLAAELTRAVQNSQITSPADVCVPSMVGGCLGGDVLAVIEQVGQPTDVVEIDGKLRTHARGGPPSRTRELSRRLAGQLRPYDSATRILFAGAAGLLLMIALDWIVSATALHETAPAALYSATRIVATVGPAAAQTAPSWYLVFSSLCMLTTIGLIAIFTAGIVNRLMSDRSIALVGRRIRPRHDHIVVVGLGQVGLRLAIRLRQLHVPVLVVERDPHAANLRLAKAAGIPVYIGHAEDTRVLRAVRLQRARALACVASGDLDNIEVAIAALSLAPELRVVLRAGENEVIAETRSLFRIGEVCNISALTAAAALLGLDGQPYSAVFAWRGNMTAFGPAAAIVLETRCSCVLHREAGSPGRAAGVAGRPT